MPLRTLSGMRNSFRHLFSHLLEKLERIHCQILLKIASEILSRIFSWISYGIFFPYSFFNALAVFHRVNRAILREILTWFCLSFFFWSFYPSISLFFSRSFPFDVIQRYFRIFCQLSFQDFSSASSGTSGTSESCFWYFYRGSSERFMQEFFARFQQKYLPECLS